MADTTREIDLTESQIIEEHLRALGLKADGFKNIDEVVYEKLYEMTVSSKKLVITADLARELKMRPNSVQSVLERLLADGRVKEIFYGKNRRRFIPVVT